ncbi:hypothetical protein BT63DRAFT_452595 [Microthyrium microscopicum]|uniref:Uncharacterized protein n=1 Tax=Microthyrium microscopicum TaxID=703497 RepID=A0A6A6UIR8_9PEZI|nr:hypothetical protein BT63DRAFT_452595 [Microthyrium microscopicum]
MNLQWLFSLAFYTFVQANVEKTIFLAPPKTTLPDAGPTLETLCLDQLTPSRAQVQTLLPVQFGRHTESWYLLRSLNTGQRYEVRLCWSATQPSDFHLSTFTLPEVFDNPSLIASLANYSDNQQLKHKSGACPTTSPSSPTTTKDSLLFLKIKATPEFLSSNITLMKNPPEVLVDIILDPFLLNIIPQSLVPIGLYIIAIGIAGYVLSGSISRWLSRRAQLPKTKDKAI